MDASNDHQTGKTILENALHYNFVTRRWAFDATTLPQMMTNINGTRYRFLSSILAERKPTPMASAFPANKDQGPQTANPRCAIGFTSMNPLRRPKYVRQTSVIASKITANQSSDRRSLITFSQPPREFRQQRSDISLDMSVIADRSYSTMTRTPGALATAGIRSEWSERG